jgi:hypothetical protein
MTDIHNVDSDNDYMRSSMFSTKNGDDAVDNSANGINVASTYCVDIDDIEIHDINRDIRFILDISDDIDTLLVLIHD